MVCSWRVGCSIFSKCLHILILIVFGLLAITPGYGAECILIQDSNQETKDCRDALSINQTKRQPQLTAQIPHATKLDEDADGHCVDPERECCEGVQDRVANEDAEEGVERGKVEVVEDVAEDDADVRCQVVDQEG